MGPNRNRPRHGRENWTDPAINAAGSFRCCLRETAIRRLGIFTTLCSAALVLVALVAAPSASAQSADADAARKVAIDPATRTGKLSNGLTYYIRRNVKPENRAELRLVVRAGSILEDNDQQGLAHFVEHMAFNGTKNFRKQELVNYLESIGVKFGAHLNAYTSFDETVYMLQVPTDSARQLATGFLVLEDWAHGLAFDHAEMDRERGDAGDIRGDGLPEALRSDRGEPRQGQGTGTVP